MEPQFSSPLEKAITALEKIWLSLCTDWWACSLTMENCPAYLRTLILKYWFPDLDYSSTRNFLHTTFPEPARIGAPVNPFIVSVRIDDVIVDFLLCLPGYEEQIITRAIQRKFGSLTVWISTAEDLIIQKAITRRPKDWQDVEDLLIVQFGILDYEYIENWLTQFSDVLDQPELLTQYHALVDKASHINET